MILTADLNQLDQEIERALITGNEDDLPILGYGEINPVLRWSSSEGFLAVKRLPIFDTNERLFRYQSQFDEFISALRASQINVIESKLIVVNRDDGRFAAYCIQPALLSQALLPEVIRLSDDNKRREIFTALSKIIVAAISDQVGLDAQISNWGLGESGLVYLDVTTPMLRDESGNDRLDTDLFVASFPAVTRPMIRTFLLKRILNPYFSRRASVLDLIGNLYKENLEAAIPLAIETFNHQLTLNITSNEVKNYYRHDARFWGFGQWTRRLDRYWQRHIRRRPYPFLLPGRVPR
ncbi:unannotated protein [freshwater metagenome]|uniref:Unannotated protein n=1 Tax=freshwater metagenome TaxID=449393 RepID=A0A6J7FRV8_9ZZZZ|nr:hypothetical protein [Actinomycetota bacterium]MSV94931.1 hypothetical protein [Actinomycetota bacterium]MSW60617.1 hypothetical protein [Actinomycetota bacterium]MSY44957.1 hypothetical protein [Actinomycetota bacterium]